MADDEFSAVASIALGQFAIGAVTAVGELHSSNLGLALAGGLTTVFGWWQWRSEQRSARLNAGGLEVVADECRRLDGEMSLLRDQVEADGAKLDPLDALTTEHVLSDFVASTVRSKTPDKRAAIARAAARQFDPRLGPIYVREYWYSRVRETPELELMVISLMARYPSGALIRFTTPRVTVEISGAPDLVFMEGLSQSEIIAYGQAVARAKVKGELVGSGTGGLYLQEAGFEVAKYAAEIGKPPPAHSTG